MGGRGTFASGKQVGYTYEAIGQIEGVKVLKGSGLLHNLPEEAHSSKAYIKVDGKGNFVRYREYNADKTSNFDIDYHIEPKITGNRVERVFHIHFYNQNGKRDDVGRTLTPEEMSRYKKYFKGRQI